ncbi:FAD dependent oxidoreductase [Teratosphaeria nubilosa]|uniref:FAD dependent oxidoreductase n=1 Tax=Teratosphaeria nubilosa TaxID=161662 RepID=A0A6G1KST0_9PEZI|nr:FAD dependent oxidoreductase [Teratosphaeria nubilosa]
MAGEPFPVSNPTKPFWRTQPHPLDNHRSTVKLPERADIVIIGAGCAGASTAYHLLQSFEQLNRKADIVILEAREACSGATGRNGGHLKPDPYTRAFSALSSLGKDAAEEVASFEHRHLKEVGDLIKRENIDCDYVRTRAVDVALFQEGADEIKRKLAVLAKAGITTVDDVFVSSSEQAEGISGIKGAKGAFTYTTGTIWPYKLILHLLSKAVAEGVNLQTHTRVQAIEHSSTESAKWTVQTPRGSITATTVIHATNAYAAALLPEFKHHIVPVKGICSRIITSKADAPHLANSYILRFNSWEYDYLIPRSDGSIIVGGARRDYHRDLSNWFGAHDDSTLIQPAKSYFDGYMQRHFSGWEDSRAFTDAVWTGIMGYSDDGFPFVGSVPEKAGQFICAGFSGHGMPQVFLSAKAVATMITQEREADEVDLPRLYRCSRARLESRERHVALAAWDAVPKAARPRL